VNTSKEAKEEKVNIACTFQYESRIGLGEKVEMGIGISLCRSEK